MISVCMATFNGEKYLHAQLDSILSNIGPSDEVIISDDGSTDGTIDILHSYARNDSRIKVIDGPCKGVVANFSNAISNASGDLVFLSDQDDLWRPNKVSKILSVFAATNCDLIVHNARLIDGKGTETNNTLFDIRRSRSGLLKNFIKNSYVGCCMAFRKELNSLILPIPENIEMHDWWIGLIAERCYKPVFIKDELIGYRRHEDNVSNMHHHPVGKMIHNRALLLFEVSKRLLSCWVVKK